MWNGDVALKCYWKMGKILCVCKLYLQFKAKKNQIMSLLVCDGHSIISLIINKLSGSHHLSVRSIRLKWCGLRWCLQLSSFIPTDEATDSVEQ